MEEDALRTAVYERGYWHAMPREKGVPLAFESPRMILGTKTGRDVKEATAVTDGKRLTGKEAEGGGDIGGQALERGARGEKGEAGDPGERETQVKGTEAKGRGMDPVEVMGLDMDSTWTKGSMKEKRYLIMKNVTMVLRAWLPNKKIHAAYGYLQGLEAEALVETMKPKNFEYFQAQMGVAGDVFKWGAGRNGSNVEYEIRIGIQSTEEQGLPGQPAGALPPWLEATAEMLKEYGHSFALLPPPRDRGSAPEVGRDGECPSLEGLRKYIGNYSTVNGKIQRSEEHVVTSYDRLCIAHSMHTLSGREFATYVEKMKGMRLHSMAKEKKTTGMTPVAWYRGGHPEDDRDRAKAELIDRVPALGPMGGKFEIAWATIPLKGHGLRATWAMAMLAKAEDHKELLKAALTMEEDKTLRYTVTGGWLVAPAVGRTPEEEAGIEEAALENREELIDRVSVDIRGIPVGVNVLDFVPTDSGQYRAEGKGNCQTIASLVLHGAVEIGGAVVDTPVSAAVQVGEVWRLRTNKARAAQLREYARHLTEHQLPVWLELAPDKRLGMDSGRVDEHLRRSDEGGLTKGPKTPIKFTARGGNRGTQQEETTRSHTGDRGEEMTEPTMRTDGMEANKRGDTGRGEETERNEGDQGENAEMGMQREIMELREVLDDEQARNARMREQLGALKEEGTFLRGQMSTQEMLMWSKERQLATTAPTEQSTISLSAAVSAVQSSITTATMEWQGGLEKTTRAQRAELMAQENQHLWELRQDTRRLQEVIDAMQVERVDDTEIYRHMLDITYQQMAAHGDMIREFSVEHRATSTQVKVLMEFINATLLTNSCRGQDEGDERDAAGTKLRHGLTMFARAYADLDEQVEELRELDKKRGGRQAEVYERWAKATEEIRGRRRRKREAEAEARAILVDPEIMSRYANETREHQEERERRQETTDGGRIRRDTKEHQSGRMGRQGSQGQGKTQDGQ